MGMEDPFEQVAPGLKCKEGFCTFIIMTAMAGKFLQSSLTQEHLIHS